MTLSYIALAASILSLLTSVAFLVYSTRRSR